MGADLRTPLIVGNPAGLEVVVMVVQQPSEAFEAVLGAYGRAEASEEWAAHAMRAVRVKIDDLPAIMDAFGVDGSTAQGGRGHAGFGGARQWLGQTPTWQEIAGGTAYRRGVTLAMRGERVELPAGRLRLLGRAWIVPMPTRETDGQEGTAAALRVEVAVQHEVSRGREVSSLGPANLELPKMPTLLDAGIVLPSLSTAFTLGRDEALVIVPIEAAPAAPTPSEAEASAQAGGTTGSIGIGQVSRVEEGATATAPEALAYGPGPADESGGALKSAGPPAPRLPTVGEALLGESAREGSVRSSWGTRRQVVILLPRLPERFELMGR